MNTVGHISSYLKLVKGLNPKRQRFIIFREMLIALALMFTFFGFGEVLLDNLDVQPATVGIAGGVILFLIALKMVFPKNKIADETLDREEPFIIPIATPMIAGPSILATIMLYAYNESNKSTVLIAILLAWALSIVVFILAPWIRRALGDKTLMACERLMGLILTLLAIQMLLTGISLFVAAQRVMM